ncbi:MAG: ABC-F family ATP-binding cassette domain-containing protein, partial [Spirochaetaceae bacterium]|nr:ABC-F family ATP-binding cassette domain-containing protein [Spirochaetaceae bacterium]
LKKMRFTFPPAPHSGRLVLTLEGVSKSYDGVHQVLSQLDLVLEKGERLVVVGCNGSGKTTLLKILAKEDASFEGSVREGAGVAVGYFSQDSAERICGSTTVLEYIEGQAPLELVPRVRDMLGSFLFRGDDVFKSLDVLSGGEKSRLALLQLLLRPVNLLILDEPTNHLDLHSKDVLLEALKDFDGTVVFVSHDRGFIQSLATRVLELSPAPEAGFGDEIAITSCGRARNFPGSYEYYLERVAAEAEGREVVPGQLGSGSGASGGRQSGQSSLASSAGGSSTSSSRAASMPSAGALQYEEQKKLKNQRRKLEREEERLLEEIAAAEEEKQQLENQLAQPEVYSDAQKSRQVQAAVEALATKIDQLTAQWEEVSAQLEG